MDTSLIDRLAEVKQERPDDESEEMVTTTTEGSSTRRRTAGMRRNQRPSIAHALCLNIPCSVFPNKNQLTLGHLIRTESGKKYFKLAALLGDMCFQQSLEPDERAGSPNRHKRGGKRSNNNNGQGGEEEAIEEGRTTAPGCFWYEPNDGEEFQHRNSDHIIDGVRSPSGTLLWIRLIFLVYNPEFNPLKLVSGIIKENQIGKERDARATTRRTPTNQFDYPKDWRCYRDIASPEAYGKLLEDYLDLKGLADACKDTIDAFSPEHVFDMKKLSSLSNGISKADRNRAHPSYVTLGRYFEVGRSGKYILRSDGTNTLAWGVDSMNPSKMISVRIPPRTMKTRSLFMSSIPSLRRTQEASSSPLSSSTATRGGQSEDERALSEAFERMRVCTDDEARASAMQELIRIREASTSGGLSVKARSGGSLLSSYSYDSGEVEEWDCVIGEEGEMDEVEITNKAIRRRAENHEELRMIYGTCEFGSPEYYEAITKYKQAACDRLVADFASYKEEEEQWEDVYLLIFAWLDCAVSQPTTFWPTINRVFPNLSMFGNTMIRDVSMFIQGFRLEPGWKPAYLQELLMINLDVYHFHFGLKMNKLLSGGASMGKSVCLEKLEDCRVKDTLIHATDMTEKTLTTGNASKFFNGKTLVFGEAPRWMVCKTHDGKNTSDQSSIVKEVLTTSKTFSLRNHWDSEKGESNVSVSKSVFNTNAVAATNVEYPDKNTPLMTRFIVDDVVNYSENPFSVRDIAWVLQHQKDVELEELVKREHKVRQCLHAIVDLFITSMSISDVNLDIPILLLPGVTEFLQDKYGIPPPDLKRMGMILNACRVETIQHAIRMRYFSEIGQVKHQFVTKKEEGDAENPGGKETIVMTADGGGGPKKKRFDVSTLPHEIEPMLFCTEDIFAYIMKLFESQFVPCVVGEVRKAIMRLVDRMKPGLHKLKMRTEDGIWYDTFETKYLELSYTSHDKFYRDVADQTGGKINTITVKSAIRELGSVPIVTNVLPRLKRRADKSKSVSMVGGAPVITTSSGICPYEVMDSGIEAARMRDKPPKKQPVDPIVFKRTKEGNAVVVCIARCLLEKELPQHIPVVNPETGDYTRGEPIGINYGNAMKEALKYAMSHYATRPRRVVIPGTLFTRGKKYPELLDYIDLKRDETRVIMRINHIAPQSTRALFVDYAAPTKRTTQGFRAPVQIVDTDMEAIVARNHARAIGREFDPMVLPAVQEQLITVLREDLPDVFSNETVLYPEEMSLLVEMDSSRTTMVANTMKKAAKEGNLDVVLKDKRFASFMMSNAYKTKFEGLDGGDDDYNFNSKVWGEEDAELVREAIMEEEEKMTSEFSSLQEVTSQSSSSSSHKRKEPETASEMDMLNEEEMRRLREGDAILKRIKQNQRYSGRVFTPSPSTDARRDPEGEIRSQVEKAMKSLPRVKTSSPASPSSEPKETKLSMRLRFVRKYQETLAKKREEREEMMKAMEEEEEGRGEKVQEKEAKGDTNNNNEEEEEAEEEGKGNAIHHDYSEHSFVNTIMTSANLNKMRKMDMMMSNDDWSFEKELDASSNGSDCVMKEGDSSTMMGGEDDDSSNDAMGGANGGQKYNTNDIPEAETLALLTNF